MLMAYSSTSLKSQLPPVAFKGNAFRLYELVAWLTFKNIELEYFNFYFLNKRSL